MRKCVGLVIVAAALLLPSSTIAASPTRASTTAVPLGVDASAMRSVTRGPVVASGTLTNSRNRTAKGTVAITAWPNEAFQRRLHEGSQFATPTVGWARAGKTGAFTVRLDTRSLGADYVNANGTVNLVAIGWTPTSQGRWAFPAYVGPTGSTSTASGRAATPVARFTIRANDPLSAARDQNAGDVHPLVSCSYQLLSSYDAMGTIGRSVSYGSDTSWMKSGSSHTMTVGAAASVTGAYGSWSASGTSSTTSGVTFTWAQSVAYREYQVQLRYGKFRLYCGGLGTSDFAEMVRYPTGGFTTAGSSSASWSNCAPASKGQWERTKSGGKHFSTSVGVKIASELGINLSMDSNYDSSHTLYYKLVADGKVCGDNAVPSMASNVRSSR